MRLIVCLMLLTLISVASAGPSRITTGQYNITFDLNTPQNYTVEVMPPLEDSNYTSYTALINVANDTKAGIYIWDLKAPEDATIMTIENVYKAYTHDLQNASVEIGKIDGKDGIIAYYVYQQNRQTSWADIGWTARKSITVLYPLGRSRYDYTALFLGIRQKAWTSSRVLSIPYISRNSQIRLQKLLKLSCQWSGLRLTSVFAIKMSKTTMV